MAAAASTSSAAFMANTHVLFPRAQPPPQDKPTVLMQASHPLRKTKSRAKVIDRDHNRRADTRDLLFQDHCKTETKGQHNEQNEHYEYQHNTSNNNCTIKIIYIMLVDNEKSN